MKAILRWIGSVIGGALTLVLVVVLLPYASTLAAKVMPDEGRSAIKVSAVLASNFAESARLETFTVEADGVLNEEFKAALIGTVGSVNLRYTYQASFGIDLKKVEFCVSGNQITLVLPEAEVLQDSLRPTEAHRDDFWVSGFKDADYEQLIEDERIARREAVLAENEEAIWQATVSALESTFSEWLKGIASNAKIEYVKAEPAQE